MGSIDSIGKVRWVSESHFTALLYLERPLRLLGLGWHPRWPVSIWRSLQPSTEGRKPGSYVTTTEAFQEAYVLQPLR